MKILYFTDTHIRGNSPRSRTDDFPTTIFQKINEIKEIAHREKVDYVLHGGDVFDHPNLSPAVVRDFASVFREFGVPIYVIAGNHDIYAHNPVTIPRTMLGLLDAFGTLQLINEGDRIYLEKDGVSVQLSGQPFHYDLDKRDPHLDYAVKNELDTQFCIHMVHSMLVDRSLPEGIAHTMISRIWELDSDVDVLLTGHYHAGFSVQQREGRWIINPGAVARVNNQLSEINRIPQIVLLECTDQIDVRLIPLEVAKPGDEVLDRSHIEKAQHQQEQWAKFVQRIEEASEFKSLHLDDIITEIASNEKLDDQVKNEAMRRLGVVMEQEGVTNT